ncbi:MAG: cytochrome C oxidase subunit IV family protein [Planctomycetes bacterium]|nr:cytochrome C oxidase subunit IV family protein [Planctomycetota bacterium]
MSETTHDDHHHEGLEGGLGHVSTVGALLKTIAALLVLTVITVAVAQVHLGDFNVIGALIIASIKATIVMLFFMHLRYDNRYNFLIMASSFAMAAFFIGYVAMDAKIYQKDINDWVIDRASAPQGETETDEDFAKRQRSVEQTK